MLMMVGFTLAGLALLYFGGETLVRGASALASRLGVPPLAIGLTVVAFGTSAPEMAVSIDAALSGSDDIALGNVIGSNITNIALILGLCVLIKPLAVQAKIVHIDAPLMVVVTAVLVAMLADGEVSLFEGSCLLTGLVLYVVFTFWEAKHESPNVQDEFAAAAPESHPGMSLSIVMIVFGLLLLVGGGRLLVTAAVDIATLWGVSEAVIGLTIVAVGTSLPELATSVIAVRKGQSEIAVGNIIGSNLFNILAIVGITTVIHPLQVGHISEVDVGVMMALSATLGLTLFIRRRLGRVEGVLLVAAYVAYTGWLFAG